MVHFVEKLRILSASHNGFISNTFRILSYPDPDPKGFFLFTSDQDPAKGFGSDRFLIQNIDKNTRWTHWSNETPELGVDTAVAFIMIVARSIACLWFDLLPG